MSGMCEDGIDRVVNGPCYVWKAFVLEWGVILIEFTDRVWEPYQSFGGFHHIPISSFRIEKAKRVFCRINVNL